jgi:negative regulator of flagellin synthesis FlgM
MIDKINKAGIQGAQNLQEVKGKGEKNVEKLKGKAEEKKVTDALVVEEGKKIAEYIELAKSYPEIRTELVKQIKDAIDSGTFKVNPEQIAKKILEG